MSYVNEQNRAAIELAVATVAGFIAPALVRVDSRDELSKTYRQGGLGSTDILDQISRNP